MSFLSDSPPAVRPNYQIFGDDGYVSFSVLPCRIETRSWRNPESGELVDTNQLVHGKVLVDVRPRNEGGGRGYSRDRKEVFSMSAEELGELVSAADAADPSATGALARFAPLDTVGTDEEVRDNLRYLKLRFWGEHIDPGDDEGVAGLETLYRAVVSHVEEVPVNPAAEALNQSPRVPSREGWGAVCVALFSSPAFHLY